MTLDETECWHAVGNNREQGGASASEQGGASASEQGGAERYSREHRLRSPADFTAALLMRYNRRIEPLPPMLGEVSHPAADLLS